MKLIVGLGNPGERYKYTPHNMGFLVVERLARKYKVDFKKGLTKTEVAEFRLNREKIILARPLRFMNLSGMSVLKILKKRKIERLALLVICDDINLPWGKIRVRRGGTDGGHLGLRSIIQELGTEDFARLRIGVGKSDITEVSNYVLEKFSKEGFDMINNMVDKSVEAVLVFIKEGINRAMNKFN